ncbi:hypothetical protein T05_11558 [Trichinella murrelli]|uniref:Uncharacterized protein n=1 Tax=Trichinella murrelli TaxID=144512 RepID=A0A0V0TYH4_9BILA|nr:hypothetical protein T05_11558 [Trichinella murrelli]
MVPVHRAGVLRTTIVYFLLEPRSSRKDGTCLIPVYSVDTVCENRNHKKTEKNYLVSISGRKDADT